MTAINESVPTILIIDDTPADLTVLSDLLRHHGFRVRPAINGAMALKEARQASPDLVILDIQMPGMDGFEVCRRLKADPATADIPVIFISARDEPVDTVKAFKAGGVDYIAKPFNHDVLLARIRIHLNTHCMQIALQRQNIQLQHEIAERKLSEEKVRDSEMRYRSILEASPDPIVIYDPEGRTLYINPAFERLYGWTPEELLDRRIDFVPDEEREPTRKAWQRTLEGESVRFETRRLNTYGETLNIEVRTAILKDRDGKHTASIVIHRDIDRQKQTEAELRKYRDHLEDLVARRTEALRESEERYRIVLETSPDPIVAYDLEGRAIYINPTFTRVFGWTFDEVRGKRIDYVPAEEQVLTRRMIHKIINEEKLTGFETRRLTKAGNILDFNINGAVFRDGEGRLAGTVVMLRDITERKQAEIRLKDSEEKFRNLFESAPEGIVITTLDGEILSFNKAFMQIFKYSDQDALRRTNIRDLYVEPQKDRHSLIAQLQEKGQLENVELDFQDVLGKPFIASLSLRLIKYDQKNCIQTILRDVTRIKKMEAKLKSYTEDLEKRVAERTTQLEAANRRLAEALENVGKMARQAKAANEAKSNFLANMSHELRTPLNAILGYAQLLAMRYKNDKELSERLGTIEQSGEHLLTLINDILDLSKIEAGRLDLYPSPMSLPDFLEGIANIARSRAHAKNLEYQLITVGPVPEAVQADDTRLRQVLLNLLGNAIKFTSQGQVCLRVLCLDPGQAGESKHRPTVTRLRFEVHDTGCGIEQDQLDRIFAPFEQVGDVSMRAEGTGLGLTISRQLVQMMGGELHAQSPAADAWSENVPGSTFWFELSLPLAETIIEVDQPFTRVITGYRGPKRKMLIVDDIESNRMLLMNLLEPIGFEIAQARDGLEAVAQAKAGVPDIILIDLRMPVLDGWEAIGQIRQVPLLSQTCIIAVSASVTQADRSRGRTVGVDDFLVKPIEWDRLVDLLAQHLNLQWNYAADDGAFGKDDIPAPEAPFKAPPKKEMEELYELARMGKISQLITRARDLGQANAPYQAFAEKLAALTGRYQIKQIQAMMRYYLEKGE